MFNNRKYNFENARIGFRNFEGKEGLYNKEGDRSFALFLSEEDADRLAADGWNVKWPKSIDGQNAEEDTREPYIIVSVSYKNIPPKVYMITEQMDGEKQTTLLEAEDLLVLDWSEFEQVDLVLNPSRWEVNGKTGTKAYLKAGYFLVATNEFDKKYGI